MPLTGEATAQDDLNVAAEWQVGTYEWWPEEDRLTWSCGLIRMYGLDRAPKMEEGFTRLVHPEDRVRVEAETAGYLGSAATSYSHGFRIVCPDGAVRFILDRGRIERDASGRVRVIRWLNVDLTDFAHLDKRAMIGCGAAEVARWSGDADQHGLSTADGTLLSGEAVAGQVEACGVLEQGEAQLQEILEAADAGTWQWQVGAERAIWSPHTFEVFGLDPASGVPPLPQWLEESVHPEDRDRARCELDAASKLGPDQAFSIECRIVHPERGVRWVATSGRMVSDGAGGPARLIGLVVDVTKRRRRSSGCAIATGSSTCWGARRDACCWTPGRRRRCWRRSSATSPTCSVSRPTFTTGRSGRGFSASSSPPA